MRTVSETIGPIGDAAGQPAGLREEVARLQVELERVREAARRDDLTQLWNRAGCNRILAEQLGGAPEQPAGVLMIDVDHFKSVNDNHGGHAAGDAVLKEFAERLRQVVGGDGQVGRWSGDEFLAVLPGADQTHACNFADTICGAIRAPAFSLPGGVTLTVTATVGVACFPLHGSTADAVQRAADGALMQAKREDRRDQWLVAQ
jgi:diguanylate cyclase (GGDEF)-like protein